MAIKGKTKARSRRSVTPGPKPVYVVPKKRLIARRGFQIGVLVVLVIAAGAGITYGLINERHQQRDREIAQRLTDAMGTFKQQVDSALSPSVGQQNQTSGFDVTPDAIALLSSLKGNKPAPKDAVTTATTDAAAAKKAASAIDAIDTVKLLRDKGFDATLVTTVQSAQSQMVNGLKLYETIDDTLAKAAQATGSARSDLLGVASQLAPTAKGIFDEGYGDYVNAQIIGQVYSPPGQPGAPGVPGGIPGGVPSGIPGGIPGGVPPATGGTGSTGGGSTSGGGGGSGSGGGGGGSGGGSGGGGSGNGGGGGGGNG